MGAESSSPSQGVASVVTGDDEGREAKSEGSLRVQEWRRDDEARTPRREGAPRRARPSLVVDGYPLSSLTLRGDDVLHLELFVNEASRSTLPRNDGDANVVVRTSLDGDDGARIRRSLFVFDYKEHRTTFLLFFL